MFKKFLIVMVVGFFFTTSSAVLAADSPQELKVYTFRVEASGGPMGIYNVKNFELAARRLNQILEIVGSQIRVEVDGEYSALKWAPFIQKFYMEFKARRAPDIITHRSVAELAAGGFIIPLDEHVEAFWESNYYDFYPNIWETVKWRGKIWGIPTATTCPGGVWYRKDVLRKLGYSDDEINKMLPSTGEKLTIDTLEKLAKEALDAGLVDYGIVHRPSGGDFWFQLLGAFGAKSYNSETENLILDKPATLRMFQWFAKMVEEGIVPSASLDWKTLHAGFVEGKFFSTYASHAGTVGEWKEKFGLADKTLKEDLGFIPYPPAVPGVLPVSPIGAGGYLVVAQCEHPDIAALLCMLATSPEAVAISAEYEVRPPTRKAALNHLRIRNMEYVQKVAPLVEAATISPAHADVNVYAGDIFNAVRGIEAGMVSPTQALKDLEPIMKDKISGLEIIE